MVPLLAFAQSPFIHVLFLSFIWAWILYVSHLDFQCTVFSWKNSRGRLFFLFFFFTQKGFFNRGKAIISIVHWKPYPVYFVNQKMITSSKLNMGFLSVPNLFPWLNFNVKILSIRA